MPYNVGQAPVSCHDVKGMAHKIIKFPLILLLADLFSPTNTNPNYEVWIPSYGAKPAVTAEATSYQR